MTGLEGLLLIDKPEGPTSHDVVARIRRASGQRRVGHAGTLDPPASGLLPVMLGRGTRLIRFLPQSPKLYRGALRLGVVTSTDDATGEVLRRHDGPLPDADRVLAHAARLRGRLLQRPPAVSARKVGGQRLYRLARKGIHVEVAPRAVEVSGFRLEPTGADSDWRFAVSVSSGTYVRSLARDLGEALGCGATLLELRRTAIGPLVVDRAVRVDALEELTEDRILPALVPLDDVPLTPPVLRLSESGEVAAFCSGSLLTLRPPEAEGFFRVEDPCGKLLGVAEAVGGGLQPRVVVRGPRDG